MTTHEPRGAAPEHSTTPAQATGPADPPPAATGRHAAPSPSGDETADGRDEPTSEPAADPAEPADGPVDGPTDEVPPGDRSDGDAAEGAGDGSADGPADSEHAAKVAAWRDKSRKRTKPKRPFWVELPLLILIAFGLTFLIQTFIAKVYYVPSGSMEQTLHGSSEGGDRILANKVVYDFRDPQRGDVVVFSGPPSWAAEASIPGPTSWLGKVGQALGSVIGIAPPNEKDFVKRVIAVGGETVACCDAAGNVTINGLPLDESSYIYQPIEFRPGELDCTTVPVSRRCFGPVTVPEGQLWLMGDHRSNSADSSWGCQQNLDVDLCQGPVPVDNVIGKAVFIVMPPSRWGTIGNPDVGPHPEQDPGG